MIDMFNGCPCSLLIQGDKAEEVLSYMNKLECCREAGIIGYFEEKNSQVVYIENGFGNRRILTSLEGDLLPRIC
jgi:hydrogenase expression/formation protein HypE